jgi:hypothetical protein|tara:strand:- start:1 stop:228 length:228 start_codon:yes stop_codon:yes gene_type:complete
MDIGLLNEGNANPQNSMTAITEEIASLQALIDMAHEQYWRPLGAPLFNNQSEYASYVCKLELSIQALEAQVWGNC